MAREASRRSGGRASLLVLLIFQMALISGMVRIFLGALLQVGRVSQLI